MRIPTASFVQRMLNNVQSAQASSQQALESLSDLRRVRVPSDDPLAAGRALRLRARFVENEGRLEASKLGTADLTTIEQSLSSLVTSINTAISESVAAGGDLGPEQRDAIAIKIEGIREDVLAAVNTQQSGRYLLSGAATFTEPFDATGNYLGSSNQTSITLANGRSIDLTVDSSQIIGGSGDNLLTDLDALITALRANDDSGIQAAQPDLEARLQDVLLARQAVGNRQNAIRDSITFIEDEAVRIQQRLADLEQVDLSEAVVEVSESEAAVSATSTALARSIGQSLFDFLA